MAQQVKNPPAIQETQEPRVQSLGHAGPLEKKMATKPCVPAWEIPWRGGAWRATVHGVT